MNFIVKILRTSDFTEYELGLPQNDIEEYFLTHGWLNEFKSKDYLCIGITGDIELDYEETLDIAYFNNMLLEIKKLDIYTQDKIKTIMESAYNTIESMQYALDNHNKYAVIPNGISKKELSKYIFEKVLNIKSYNIWGDCISSDEFMSLLLSRGCAYKISGKILIKSIDLTEGV